MNGEQNQQWYYNSHHNYSNTFHGYSTRPMSSLTSKGVRADAPKIFCDRSTQWERRPEWAADAATQTEIEEEPGVYENDIEMVD